LPISAVDTIALAFQHTKRQLVQPFRFWQWARLAFVGLLAGEMGSGGGCNVPTSFPHQSGGSRHLDGSGIGGPGFGGLGVGDLGLGSIDPAVLAGLIAVLVVAGLVFWLIMMYVSSVMRFILFDSVLAKECRIRAGWSRRQSAGWKYFVWQLGFGLIVLMAMVVLVGIPALVAFLLGWFAQPNEHILGLALSGIVLFVIFLAFVVAAAVVHVLTKDFVVPQMALEGIGVIEGWRRLWPMLQGEAGGYTVYVLIKVVLAMGAGIVIGLVSLVVTLVVAIPTVLLGLVAVLTGKSAGLTWNAFTITVAIVVGCVLLAVFMYLLSLVAVPAIVFFPAYAIYFFAARYRALSLALYPPAAVELGLPFSGLPPESFTPTSG
jgi:hypothetical protein